MKTVLLTNGQQRKTLAVARSLGKRGIRVITSDETYMNPTGFSKYCHKSLVYPNPKTYPEKFYNWLCETIVKYECDVLFPMDDDTLDIVMENLEELNRLCIVPVSSIESYHIASDKGNSTRLAEEVKVPCPKTLYIKDLSELEKVEEVLSFPMIIKPRKSSGSRGIRVVCNKADLIEHYNIIHKDHLYPIIQECIGLGTRYDVCLLFDKNNKLKASFTQKELRHFPVEMGPSTLQQSIVYPEIEEMALKIMNKLKWYGIIEFEFMLDSNDGKIKFMEINPRFWASLQMSIYSGVDFPWLLYNIAIGENIKKHISYDTGIMCRWLLPGDILHFISNKERNKMMPPIWGGKKYKVYDDILSKDDPLPLLGFILACIRYAFDIKMWKLMFKR